MSQAFQGYELLLLKRLQNDPHLCNQWKDRLFLKFKNDSFDIGEIPHSLWYLTVTLDRKKDRFLQFVHREITRSVQSCLRRESMLTTYLNNHQFTELHLDGIFKYGEDNSLPPEIFRCSSVQWLSLKYNYLDHIPADIGRMRNLQYLALTNNKLQNKSIPYTLFFCSKLRTLLLDNNLLDALPGFLLKMTSLDTVHRHGNHNYFKSTFMWYHTDVNERILAVMGTADFIPKKTSSLQFWAAKSLIGSKLDFFSDVSVAPMLKDYIASIYSLFNVCGSCSNVRLSSEPGFKVITFKNPYLGNTCVPFQHWACSITCAQAIEIPARLEQINAAHELDVRYESYVHDCQKDYSTCFGAGHRLRTRHVLSDMGNDNTEHSASLCASCVIS